MPQHIALLGDSIFDNAAYTQGQPDVVTHLRQVLPAGTIATLLAVDGSTTEDIVDQRVPVIDLRLVVTDQGDYANPLEPSSQGARKIARSIAAALGFADSVAPVSEIFAVASS